MRKVASRSSQHSKMLRQPASWQTVWSPSDFTSDCRAVYSGPIFARVLIHSGLRSMGVWALRTSRRSILRPSGATADTTGSLALILRRAQGYARGFESPRRCSGCRCLLDHSRLQFRVLEYVLQMPLDDRQDLADGHVPAELAREGGDPRVTDAAGDDPVEPLVVRVHVQREAVHRHALGDPDADRRDLAVLAALSGVGRGVLRAVHARVELLVHEPGVEVQGEPADRRTRLDRVAQHPYATAALDPAGLQAELRARADQGLFQAPYVRHHVHRTRELLDRVAHQLARTVPGDLAAAVHVDDGGAVEGALAVRGAPARRIHRGVFEQQDRVGDLVLEPRRVHPALLVPRLLVLDRVRTEAHTDEPQPTHGKRLPRRS